MERSETGPMVADYRTDFDVELVNIMGNDEMICHAARVSTLGTAAADTDESAGLINFLMKNRHGTPFEHNSMTFRICAPIFVWREFMRHRIGFSYNEESGRYRELDGVFYRPPRDRPLVQEGKAGEYNFTRGADDMHWDVNRAMSKSYSNAWVEYKIMLSRGVAKEVARMVLPVSIYSAAYVTCNARSLMSFLSLRTKDERSMFPSYPMWEINQVALAMENLFAANFPTTYEAYNKNGRVSP